MSEAPVSRRQLLRAAAMAAPAIVGLNSPLQAEDEAARAQERKKLGAALEPVQTTPPAPEAKRRFKKSAPSAAP